MEPSSIILAILRLYGKIRTVHFPEQIFLVSVKKEYRRSHMRLYQLNLRMRFLKSTAIFGPI